MKKREVREEPESVASVAAGRPLVLEVAELLPRHGVPGRHIYKLSLIDVLGAMGVAQRYDREFFRINGPRNAVRMLDDPGPVERLR